MKPFPYTQQRNMALGCRWPMSRIFHFLRKPSQSLAGGWYVCDIVGGMPLQANLRRHMDLDFRVWALLASHSNIAALSRCSALATMSSLSSAHV